MITPRTEFVKVAVGQHYDELDSFYREIWGEHLHHGYFERGDETVEEATEALIERVATAAEIEDGDRVCDVGCGYGGTARWLAENRHAHVSGFTLSDAQAEYARIQDVAQGAPAPTIFRRDWLENGLPNERFDAVLAIESTTHMPDRARVFSEMARVLNPGGRLAACIWMTSERPSRAAVNYVLEPVCREGRLAGIGSLSENRRWIEDAGLIIMETKDWSRCVARTWTICAKRVFVGLTRRPEYRQFLFDASKHDRSFVRTLIRLRLGYAFGAMKYYLLVARKPD